MSNEQSLRNAIDRSISYTERVAVEYTGDESALLADLNAVYDGEIDSAIENDGTIDVWGFDEHTPAGEMAWRLCVTLTN